MTSFMHHRIIVALSVVCCFLGFDSAAQSQTDSRVRHEILIFRTDREVLRGAAVDLRGDTIVVSSPLGDVTLSFAAISRIILRLEAGPSRGPIYGGVLAAYASAAIILSVGDRDGFVKPDNLAAYGLLAIPSIAVGVGIGYLFDHDSRPVEDVFDFTGSDAEKDRERGRLIAALARVQHRRKIHVSLQSGEVYSNLPALVLPDPYGNYDHSAANGFNLLRKIQVTYSVTPEVEAGAGLLWFGETGQSRFGYEYFADGSNKTYSELQSFNALGKMAVATYEPLKQLLGPGFSVKLGGGVGAALGVKGGSRR